MGDDGYVYTQIYRYSERFRVKIKDQHIIVDLFTMNYIVYLLPKE